MRDPEAALYRLKISLERVQWLVNDLGYFILDLEVEWLKNAKACLRWAEEWCLMAEDLIAAEPWMVL